MLNAYTYRNNVRNVLDAGITNSDTTIDLTEASSPYNNPAFITPSDSPAIFTLVDNPAVPTKIEIIRATAIVPGSGVVRLQNVTRGLEGTTAQSWPGGTMIFQALTQKMLNPPALRLVEGVGSVDLLVDTTLKPFRIAPATPGSGVGFDVSADSVSAGAGTFESATVQFLDVQGRLRPTAAAPATSTGTGAVKEIRVDANYLYVCTANNTWKRIALSAF